MTLIVASDFKFRTRPPSDALSASIDAAILIELGLYALVGTFLVLANIAVPRTGRPSPQVYLACFFIGLMGLSLLYTPFPQYAMARVGQMVVLLLLTLAAVTHATRAHMHRFAHLFLAVVIASAAYGLAVPSVPVSRLQEGRFTWLAIHPTVSGVLAGLAALIALAYVVSGRRPRPGPVWPFPFYVASLVVVGSALLGSQTRGAILGVGVGAMVLVLASRGGRAVIEATMAIMLALVVVALVASGPVVDYFVRDSEPEDLASLNSRTELWDVAIVAVGENPMFGYGVTAAQGLFYDETGLGGGHNAVVNLLVELGLVGLIVWTILNVVLLVGVRMLDRTGPHSLGLDRAFLLSVLAFLIVDGIFFQGPGAVTNVASTWLFVCVAWLSVAQRESSRPGQAVPPMARRRAHA